MAGLTDMEELIASVPEKDIATYLREAYVCYGAGAYRGCVVLVHTALFEGLRLKLKAISSSNSTARQVLAVIDPDAEAQKVFEQKLIDQMRISMIITQLEADILVQLNKQRNKAAHPSGHQVTAEEARFVFSEAIKKFLSKPIRQTSVLVNLILDRMSEPHFFPTPSLPDVKMVVDQEIFNLDPSSIPELVKKVGDLFSNLEQESSRNAEKFLVALASRREKSFRDALSKQFMLPKSSNDANAAVIVKIIAADPEIIKELLPADKMRISSLLLKNATNVGIDIAYYEMKNPAYVLSMLLQVLGEDFVIAEYKPYCDWVISRTPAVPDFVKSLKSSGKLLNELQHRFRIRASNHDFAEANAFANAAPNLDVALADVSSDEYAFIILCCIDKAAKYNAYAAVDLARGRYSRLPNMKKKAISFLQRPSEEIDKVFSKYAMSDPGIEFRKALLQN